jgi:site-specific DNA-methyltransferase (adenine-specific)
VGGAVIDMRLGRWQDVLQDVQCDSLITDTPFSARTDKGFRTGTVDAGNGGFRKAPIGYAPIDQPYAQECIEAWAPRVKHWFVVFGDHITARWFLDAMDSAGLYTFPPVPWTKVDGAPRYCGDGPSSQTEFIAIGRHRVNVPKRYRPGHYRTRIVTGNSGESIVTGQKPVNLMRAIVRDYSEPGDLVCDPHAGSGSTLVAASCEGRRAIGAEMDPDTFNKATARIARGHTLEMNYG